MASTIDSRYETRYSIVIAGDRSNHHQSVRFDHSPGGYIGISDRDKDGTWGDRVLLTPAQADALIAFIRSRGRATS